jgi:class 3 adenylate cyclase
VNTASRLCELAQGGEILLTPAFQAALRRPHTIVPHASVLLRGHEQPVAVSRAVPARRRDVDASLGSPPRRLTSQRPLRVLRTA